MENTNKPDLRDVSRFKPKAVETSKIRATRFTDLCKSCGECIMKCPVNAISWHESELGQLGEPAIFIDLDKCIGCETCERACPDHAIEITNKRLESARFSTGPLGFVVRSNAWVIERLVTTFRAGEERLKKIGRSDDKTLICRLARFILRYTKEPIREVDFTE
jgi:2-oxoglutarate ferredoxin oxidoreductase subunit delta